MQYAYVWQIAKDMRYLTTNVMETNILKQKKYIHNFPFYTLEETNYRL